MTLRAGRADLHQQLTSLMKRLDWDNPSDRAEFLLLGVKAAEAVLHCPVDGCAYCWNVEHQEEAT